LSTVSRESIRRQRVAELVGVDLNIQPTSALVSRAFVSAYLDMDVFAPFNSIFFNSG
jgi:hypothetical protein